MSVYNVAVVIPTYNAALFCERLLTSIGAQNFSFDLLVVDSSSIDGTFDFFSQKAKAVVTVTTKEFNHGGTRQMMVEKFSDYDIYVFMTQDAYLENEDSILEIVKPFQNKDVGAVCGRQLPHYDATVLSAHARLFNYPATTTVKSLKDVNELGMKTVFMSNSFAAYRRDALVSVGGFPSDVILSEDMYVAAKMVLKGWSVCYAAEACCRHSHNYTFVEEFKRYFDIGVFHARESWIKQNFGGAGKEGLKFVRSELAYVGIKKILLYPEIFVRTFLKALGYKLGTNEHLIPTPIKSKLSMHRRYWKS